MCPTCDGRLEAVRSVVDEEGPIGIDRLLAETAPCASELHAILWSLRAAGLIECVDTAGVARYRTPVDHSIDSE